MKLRIALAALLTLLVSLAALAQTSTAPDTRTTTATTTAAPVATTTEQLQEVDRSEVRNGFQNRLRQYPPEVGQVLKLDPTLLSDANYLAHYPAIAQFVAQHPEVAHNPQFFLDSVSVASDDRSTPGQRMWDKTIEAITIFTVMSLIAFALGWTIRTVIEQRRWNRLARVQADVHNKLLDRFTANEDLLAYIQTDAGKRFLESAPIQIDPGPRQMAAPLNRILWSVQAGLVLAAGGIGLQFVSGHIDKEVSQPLFALGVIALAVGAGFVLSAVISFLISRRLGLLPAAPTDSAA